PLNEAWEHFKDLLRQCPHHGFSELHQLDAFYNALNPNDQDALDSAVEPPSPPTGVKQQEPVEVTTDTEPPNSDDIHPPTVQAEVQEENPLKNLSW
nr:reverse transcriptase domain-containing protein [Tanacetum cinerariifolium]